MWRAFLLAIGISLLLVGGECLVLDKVILARPGAARSSSEFSPLDVSTTTRKVIVPPEAAPWVLLAGGAIAVLYSRSGGGGGED